MYTQKIRRSNFLEGMTWMAVRLTRYRKGGWKCAVCERWCFFFFSSRRRHTRYWRDWSSDVCSSDLARQPRRQRGLELEAERRVGLDHPPEAGAQRLGGGDRPRVARHEQPGVAPDRKSVV